MHARKRMRPPRCHTFHVITDSSKISAGRRLESGAECMVFIASIGRLWGAYGPRVWRRHCSTPPITNICGARLFIQPGSVLCPFGTHVACIAIGVGCGAF
eukprot:5943480-Prymnesium_polylepis.1